MGSLHHHSAHAEDWRATVDRNAASRQSSVGGSAMLLHRGVPSDPGVALPVPTSLEIRDQVNSFLAALPLGVTRKDAELEDCIAAHLHDLLNARADTQLKLNQWVHVALGLQEVVERQHADLASMHDAQRTQHAHPSQQPHQQKGLPDQAGDGLGSALAVQHAELAQLRSQMASLRQDLHAAAAAPNQAQGAAQGALEEELRARTAEVQSAREETTRLRRALVDAELELQRVTSREPPKRRGEQDRARLAAEALAAQHRAASLQECSRRQAAEITQLRAQLQAKPAAAAGKGEGSSQDGVCELTAKRQALEREVQRLQERLETAATEREEALSAAQAERQALARAAEELQAQQAETVAAGRSQKENLAQEFQAFKEAAAAQQDGLIRQLAAENAAGDEARSLRHELELERRHCSVLEATLTESKTARCNLEDELTAARSQLEERVTALEREHEELAAAKIGAEEEFQIRIERERERAAADGRRLAELACQADERADVIADLTARLADADASWQAHHRAAILDLQAAHSEELERLQAEHALELASVEAAAEADREHSEAVAAALRCARFEHSGNSAAASDEDCAEESSPLGFDGGCDSAASLEMASQRATEAAAPKDDGRNGAAPAAGDVGQPLLEQMDGLNQNGKGGVSPGQWLFAVLAATALTSAWPLLTSAQPPPTSAEPGQPPHGPSLSRGGVKHTSAADAVCSVSLGGAAGPAATAVTAWEELAAGGIAAADDATAPDQAADPGRSNAAVADKSGSGRAAADAAHKLLQTAQACQDLQAEVAAERACARTALAELQEQHQAELALVRQQCAAEVAAAEAQLDSALQELREQLKHEQAAELAALQRQQEGKLAELQTRLEKMHQQEVEGLQEMHQKDLADVLEGLEAEKDAALEELQSKIEADLAAQQDRLSSEHAAELAALEQQHREVGAAVRNELAIGRAAELAAALEGTADRQAAELAAMAAQHDSALSQLRADLESWQEEEIAALREQHAMDLAEMERRLGAEVAALREEHESALAELSAGLQCQHEAELAALISEHESAVARVKAGLQASYKADSKVRREQNELRLAAVVGDLQGRHQAELAALRHQLGSCHKADLLAVLAKQFEAGAASDARHSTNLRVAEARLRAQQEAELADLKERLLTAQREAAAAAPPLAAPAAAAKHPVLVAAAQSDPGEDHSRQVESMAAEHAAALAQLQKELNCAHSRAVDRMASQHAAELCQLRQELQEEHACAIESRAAEHAAAMAEVQEQLKTEHAGPVHGKTATAQVLEQLQKEHARAIESMAVEHAAATAQLKQELELDHAAAIAQLRQELEREHPAVADFTGAEHASQLAELQYKLEREHAAAVAQLRQELEEEQGRAEMQNAVMEDLVASVRANCEERVQHYKAKLKEAEESLHACQQRLEQNQQQLDQMEMQQPQDQQLEQQQQPETQEEFVIRRRDSFGSGRTLLNRGWQTERKPSLRHAMAQLEADNADLLARCRAAEASATAESRASDDLRRENLELAAELAEAGAAGRAAADASRELRDRLDALQLRGSAAALVELQQSPDRVQLQLRGSAAAADQLLMSAGLIEQASTAEADVAQSPDHAASPQRLIGQPDAAEPELADEPSPPISHPSSEPDLAPVEAAAEAAGEGAASQEAREIARSGSPDLSRLHCTGTVSQGLAGGDALNLDQEEGDSSSGRQALEEAVQELTARCEALEAENLRLQDQVGGALGEELAELQGACLSLRRSNQDLASQLAAAAGGRAAGDALSADDNATLRQTLADMEAQLAAAAAEAERLHDENFELSLAAADNKFEVQELTEALEDRDAVEADLRARIADLYALDAARGDAAAGASDLPKLVSAQLRIETLEAQLRKIADAKQAQQDSTAVCSRCGETLQVSADSPGQGAPDQAAAAHAPNFCEEPSSSKFLNADAENAAMVLEGNAVVEALAAAHAAEVASMQEAFQARAQALEEDLHAKEELLEQQQEALGAAAEQLAARQDALLECQDMVGELQAFSEAQQAQLHSLQQQLQAAQGQAEQARAGAREAEEQLSAQQRRAEEAARQLAEAERHQAEAAQKLEMREGTLQELTLENQRLQLELSERRGQLRASRAACVETRARVESLAARLASAHNAEPVGMIWQNPQGNSLSATGSGSIVKALQAASLSREMVVRVPSRPASPAAASRGASANFGDGGADISIDEVQAQADTGNEAGSVAAGDPGHLGADAADCTPLLASRSEEVTRGIATESTAGFDWESDQENEGDAQETYSLGVTNRRRRNVARRLEPGQALAETPGLDQSSAQLGGIPDACTPCKPPFGSLHHNALFGDTGSSGSPDSCSWAAWRSQVAETPTPLRSCENPVRDSGSSPLWGNRSSPLRSRKSVRAGCGSHLRSSGGSPLRSENPLRDSGGSPLRTRDLPRRSKSGPVAGGGAPVSSVVAAQRSLFLSPPPALPSPPEGIRDIAGRWHGTPPPQWGAA